jgi:hypothetical protein
MTCHPERKRIGELRGRPDIGDEIVRVRKTGIGRDPIFFSSWGILAGDQSVTLARE